MSKIEKQSNAINRVSNYLEKIVKSHPFLDLGEEQLKLIVQKAAIVNCNKSVILFSKEEKIKNFYIILSGLLKLTAIDTNGNEAIIKTINSGSVCSIFDDVFSYTATAIKDSVILSINLPYFRKLAKENVIILHNLYSELSVNNKDLLLQLVSLKLQDNKQKVGQFLLGNAMKNGKKIKDIELEYSKGEIAAYLGMRLETFSRIIHQLKEEKEILVRKNKVILTNNKSLCCYCNEEMANQCQDRNSSFCSNSN